MCWVPSPGEAVFDSSQAEKVAVALCFKVADEIESSPNGFAASFAALTKSVHETAKSKGWWDTDRNNGEALALIHSEVSEALEALRMGNPPDDKIPEFSGAEAELADVVIRIMDLSAARGWDVGGAIVAKMEMNKGRAKMHGGKAF